MKMLRNLLIGTATAVALASVGSSALAASTTGAVNATLIQPLTIANTSALNWGTIVRPSAGNCTVAITKLGATTGTTCQLIGGGQTTAAFDVTGDGGRTFTISKDATVTLTTGDGVGPTKQIVYTPASDATDTTPGANGDADSVQNIKVWGSIVVNNDDVAGQYSGTLNVTVNYQ